MPVVPGTSPTSSATEPTIAQPTGVVDAGLSFAAETQHDVKLVGVTKRFGSVTAVDQLNLAIERGAFYSLLGPSGCGKTTTLRMIAGFEQPSEGQILLEGRPVAGVPPYRRNVNTVFQHYALFPHMDVARNIGYGLRQRAISGADERRRVGEALALVRLSGYERRRTWELSGGQQQRVALARALVNHPAVLLLDEPLGALDRQLRHEMQLELKALHQEVGITFVYVTHDQEEALTMSDVIVVMRDGRIQQRGTPGELYQRPVNRFVAGFIGSSNFALASVVDRDPAGGRLLVETATGLRLAGELTNPAAMVETGASVTLAVRPERLRVMQGEPSPATSPIGGQVRISGRVRQGTYLGEQTEYRIDTEALGEIVVRRQNETAGADARLFGPGEAVTVVWHEDATLVLAS